MYPYRIRYKDFDEFVSRLSRKGINFLSWNEWKKIYKKDKFKVLIEVFKFLGLAFGENLELTPLGKKYILSKDKEKLVIGLIQSDYFPIYLKLKEKDFNINELFISLSDLVGMCPEKNRKDMMMTFIEFSINSNIIKKDKEHIKLTSQGKDKVIQHSKIPIWVYELPILQEAKRIESYKALMYETGHPLRDIVLSAFKELGFQAKIIPKKAQGLPDILISYNQFFALVETKGEIKQIGENDVNQLTKAQIRKEYSNYNFVFVGNAFRLKSPELRLEPFHKDAVALAIKKEIVLLSSLDLLRILEYSWKNNYNINHFIERLYKPGYYQWV